MHSTGPCVKRSRARSSTRSTRRGSTTGTPSRTGTSGSATTSAPTAGRAGRGRTRGEQVGRDGDPAVRVVRPGARHASATGGRPSQPNRPRPGRPSARGRRRPPPRRRPRARASLDPAAATTTASPSVGTRSRAGAARAARRAVGRAEGGGGRGGGCGRHGGRDVDVHVEPPDSSSGTTTTGERPSAPSVSTTSPTCGCWTSTQVLAHLAPPAGGGPRTPARRPRPSERVGGAVRAQHQRGRLTSACSRREPVVDAGSSRFSTSSGATLARTDDAASAASRGVVHAVRGSGGGTGRQAGPNSSGSSAPRATGRAGVDEGAQRHVGARRRRRRARRCTPGTPRARCPRVDDVGRARAGSSAERTPWPSRSGPRCVEHLATWSGPSSSPPCGTQASPARRAIANAGANSAVSAAALVVAQPEPDDLARAVAGVPRGQPGQGAGVERVPHPAGARRRRPTSTPVRRARRARLVEDDLQRRRDAADERGVRRRVDLDLQPAASPRRRRRRRPRRRSGACRPRRARTPRAAS